MHEVVNDKRNEKVNTFMQTRGKTPAFDNNKIFRQRCSGLWTLLKVCEKWLAQHNIYTEEGFFKERYASGSSARVRLKCTDVWMTNDVPIAAQLIPAIFLEKKMIFFFFWFLCRGLTFKASIARSTSLSEQRPSSHFTHGDVHWCTCTSAASLCGHRVGSDSSLWWVIRTT